MGYGTYKYWKIHMHGLGTGSSDHCFSLRLLYSTGNYLSWYGFYGTYGSSSVTSTFINATTYIGGRHFATYNSSSPYFKGAVDITLRRMTQYSTSNKQAFAADWVSYPASLVNSASGTTTMSNYDTKYGSAGVSSTAYPDSSVVLTLYNGHVTVLGIK